MPFDYKIKGWPASLTIGGQSFEVTSCDAGDTGLVYTKNLAKKNDKPHITIHGVDKEGPDDWFFRKGFFHVVVSNTKTYEYDWQGQPADFEAPTGRKTTGNGSIDQTSQANTMATEFLKALRQKVYS